MVKFRFFYIIARQCTGLRKQNEEEEGKIAFAFASFLFLSLLLSAYFCIYDIHTINTWPFFKERLTTTTMVTMQFIICLWIWKDHIVSTILSTQTHTKCVHVCVAHLHKLMNSIKFGSTQIKIYVYKYKHLLRMLWIHHLWIWKWTKNTYCSWVCFPKTPMDVTRQPLGRWIIII